VYLGANLCFSMAYLLVPGSVDGAEPGSFRDAFFFSVQSMSTIGYGGMAPNTLWAHLWVTLEAMFGIVLVALTTGIVFAKFARPTANVVFSDVAVITRRNGKPALMFRVANAREGALVSASMQLSVLQTETTAEGDTLRRLVDLNLARDRVPFFTLSWSLIHEIDADSPLHGLTAADFSDDDLVLVALLTGHDGDYGTTVYAQQLYYPEEVRWQHRFVDVITNENRQVSINYTKFHETEPLGRSPEDARTAG
jgi:inward rectifier potassium channel